MASDQGHIAALERVIDRSVKTVTERVARVLSFMGDRPAGFEEGTPLEQCEAYLGYCDDAMVWKQKIDEQAALYGLAAAEQWAIDNADRLEGLLAHRGGQEGVMAASLWGRLTRAEKALDKAEAIEALPKFEIRPPFPVRSPLDLLVPPDARRPAPALLPPQVDAVGPAVLPPPQFDVEGFTP